MSKDEQYLIDNLFNEENCLKISFLETYELFIFRISNLSYLFSPKKSSIFGTFVIFSLTR